MNKTFKLFGIIALVAVIGFSMLGCSNGSTSPIRSGLYTFSKAGVNDSVVDYFKSQLGIPGVATDQVINQSGLNSQIDAALETMHNSYGSTPSKTIAEIRAALHTELDTEPGGSAFADAVADKLDAQGWVIAAINFGVDSNFVIVAKEQ